jgi:hypothetical protein
MAVAIQRARRRRRDHRGDRVLRFVHPLPPVLIGMSAFGFTLLAGLLYHRHQRLLAWADAESRGDGLPIGHGRGIRAINEDELRLIELILSGAGSPVTPPAAGSLVRPLDDGGIGSLDIDGVETFGEVVGEVEFRDSDGVGVSAALYLDSHGRLYELDVFKGDFSALRRWPTDPDS